MTGVTVARQGRVVVVGSVDLPMPLADAWTFASDFTRFATLDPFHRRIHVGGGTPRAGAPIRIDHRYWGLRVYRVGRILRWRDGVGYAFSDLSTRGDTVGFPHTYDYALAPLSPATCRLTITVRGRWTARLVPRPLVALWLRWVMARTLQITRNSLLRELYRTRRLSNAPHP